MITSLQTAAKLLMTVPFSEQLSETWLLERTYHAQLRTGRELSVLDLTLAMNRLSDFYVPLSTWIEISQEEAYATSQQGRPVLLYGEHPWEHPKGATRMWGASKNMQFIISGNTGVQPEAVSGTDYAACYIDPQRGTFSNSVWKAWFVSDTATMLQGRDHSTITYFGPYVQFSYTIHYTVIAADGKVHQYADSAGAVQGFQTLPPREVGSASQVQILMFTQAPYDKKR